MSYEFREQAILKRMSTMKQMILFFALLILGFTLSHLKHQRDLRLQEVVKPVEVVFTEDVTNLSVNPELLVCIISSQR